MTLDIFGFRALWSPYFFISLVVVGIIYFLVTGKYRHRLSAESEPLSVKQAIMFVLALLTLYILKGSPVDLLGHIMFSIHMTQMGLLYLLIPPLLIVAIPDWLWRKILSFTWIRRPFHFFTKPLIALFLFNGLFSFYHIPLIFDVVKTDMFLHAIYTSILFVTAVFMWWPITNKLKEYQEFYGIKRIGYIFANAILLTPACALIIFADTAIYETFTNPSNWLIAMELCVPAGTLASLNITGPDVFNMLPLLEDQRTGGVIMKIIQEIIFGVVLAQIFFSWYREENVDSIDMNPVTDYQSAE